jgi:hypothetical protein
LCPTITLAPSIQTVHMLRPKLRPRPIFSSTLTTAKPVHSLHPRVSERFKRVRQDPFENDFHGPYHSLLHELFSAHRNIFSGPTTYMPTFKCESRRPLFTFEICNNDGPVFLLGLSSPEDLHRGPSRRFVDLQMRDGIMDIVGLLQLSYLQVWILDCLLPCRSTPPTHSECCQCNGD